MATRTATRKPAARKPAARKPATRKAATKAQAKAKPATSTKPVWQKLFIKGGTVLLLNPPPGYENVHAGAPATVVDRARGPVDTVHLFVNDVAELKQHLPGALKALGPSTSLWISYPKGRKDLHRDTLWKAVEPLGYEGVGLVAVDAVWSAMRFKPQG